VLQVAELVSVIQGGDHNRVGRFVAHRSGLQALPVLRGLYLQARRSSVERTTGQRWTCHRHISNWLTNRHLMGEVLTRDEDNNEVWHRAKWPGLVDPALFAQVQAEVERRKNEPRNRKRESKGTFILTPVCADCGMHYHGGKNAKAQGDTRTYVHAIPDQRLHAEYEDFVACGCRGWSVVADELEGKIKDLILAERGIGCYEDEVRAALAEQEDDVKQLVGPSERLGSPPSALGYI
jgi:hypothetical protein